MALVVALEVTLMVTLEVSVTPLEVGGVQGRSEELGHGLDFRAAISRQIWVLAPTRLQGSRFSQRAAPHFQHFQRWK